MVALVADAGEVGGVVVEEGVVGVEDGAEVSKGSAKKQGTNCGNEPVGLALKIQAVAKGDTRSWSRKVTDHAINAANQAQGMQHSWIHSMACH